MEGDSGYLMTFMNKADFEFPLSELASIGVVSRAESAGERRSDLAEQCLLRALSFSEGLRHTYTGNMPVLSTYSRTHTHIHL